MRYGFKHRCIEWGSASDLVVQDRNHIRHQADSSEMSQRARRRRWRERVSRLFSAPVAEQSERGEDAFAGEQAVNSCTSVRSAVAREARHGTPLALDKRGSPVGECFNISSFAAESLPLFVAESARELQHQCWPAPLPPAPLVQIPFSHHIWPPLASHLLARTAC